MVLALLRLARWLAGALDDQIAYPVINKAIDTIVYRRRLRRQRHLDEICAEALRRVRGPR